MQRFNLLYVITKLELGGAQKQLLSLINKLDKTRFKPFLFTAKEGLLLPEAISIVGLTVKKSKWLERPINPFKDLLALIEIYGVIKENNIEIVHTHSSKAGILGRLAAGLAKVNVIIHTVHGWSFHDYQPKPLQLFFMWLERLCAKFTDKIIVVSDYDKQKGLNNRIGSDNRYAFIRYSVDYKEFNIHDQTIKKELGIDNNELVVGMIACFKPQKSPQEPSFTKTSNFNGLAPRYPENFIGNRCICAYFFMGRFTHSYIRSDGCF
jgi:glycosyltransferase involved in cell wall biosynthesis